MATNAINNTHDALVELNEEIARTLIPTVVLLCLFILFGLVGNSLICYVIGFRLPPKNQTLPIVFLAIFDLMHCLIAMPGDILELRLFLTYQSAALCKFFRFVMFFAYLASSFILLTIAIDRYNKICKPLSRQMTGKSVKKLLVIDIVVAILLSWPTFVISGIRKFEVSNINERAQECSTISNDFKGTGYGRAFLAIFLITTISTCVTLVILYRKIMVAINAHNKKMRRSSEFSLTSQHRCQDDSSIVNVSETTSPTRDSDPPLNNKETDTSRDTCLSTIHYELCDDLKNTEENIQSEDLKCSTKNRPKEQIAETVDVENQRKLSCASNSSNNNCVSPAIRTQHDDSDSFPGEVLSKSKENLPDTIQNPVKLLSLQKRSSQTHTETPVRESNNDPRVITSNTGNERTEQAMVSERKMSEKEISSQRKLEQNITLTVFAVTIVYLLSFVPFIAFWAAQYAMGDKLIHSLQGAELVLYYTSARLYYLNSILNPVIYGVLNTRFRNDVKGLFKKWFR